MNKRWDHVRERALGRRLWVPEFLSPAQQLGHLPSPFPYLLHCIRLSCLWVCPSGQEVLEGRTLPSVPLSTLHNQTRALHSAGPQQMHAVLTRLSIPSWILTASLDFIFGEKIPSANYSQTQVKFQCERAPKGQIWKNSSNDIHDIIAW